jgi:ubiquinol-cytochrome c reductase cytochrome b subunit
VFLGIVFFAPDMAGIFLEPPNFEVANSLKTPAHIAPVWYFTPFYSILRAVPDKFLGFVAMAAAIAILFVLPWLDCSKVKSIRYKGTFSKVAIAIFAASFVILGVLGLKAPTPERTLLAQVCTIIYFMFFLAMPVWTKFESTKPVPERVTMNGGMGTARAWLAFLVIALLTWLPLKAVGSESEFACGTMPCDKFEASLNDKASLQRGVQTYMNYCMGCHSLKYGRYERTAVDLGIPNELFADNLMFDKEARIGNLMEIAYPEASRKLVFGAVPPDLTLVARARSPEWLYTYLRNFYVDPARPLGVNNKVFPDVGMPHVLLELQGLADCAPGPVHAENGGIKRDALTGEEVLFGEDGKALNPCGRLKVIKPGKMTEEEYDKTVYDLVNFLTYIGEPIQESRKHTGIYVMFFLALLFVFAWLLNREYWKNIH